MLDRFGGDAFGLGNIGVPDGGVHYDYQLVFDPADPSRLASRLRKEDLDFMVEPDSFHVIDLELTPPAKATP